MFEISSIAPPLLMKMFFGIDIFMIFMAVFSVLKAYRARKTFYVTFRRLFEDFHDIQRKRRFTTAVAAAYYEKNPKHPTVSSRLTLVLQCFEDKRVFFLMEEEVSHFNGFATQQEKKI